MKKYSFTISLEKFKSRLPIMIDSFDAEGSIVNFNGMDKSECYPIGNYGMIPCDVKFDNTIVPVFNEKLYKEVDGGYAIPYPMLDEMYHFYIDYDSLLSSASCPNEKNITSATEYWEIYGGDEEYYKGLDERYYEYGGDEMRQFINDCVFVPISAHTPNLITSLSATTSFKLPMLITKSIDDLGEYTIFSDEWEEKKNYYTQGLSSTTVIYDGEVYLKTGTSEGYIFNDIYKIAFFDYASWVKYAVKHASDLEGDNHFNWYTYTNDGKMLVYETFEEASGSDGANDMSTDYVITFSPYGYLAYGSTPIVCQGREYIVSPFNGEYLFVERDRKGKYVEYKERRFYFDTNGNVNLAKTLCGTVGNDIHIEFGKFVMYNYKWYLVDENDECLINEKTYHVFEGYSVISNDTVYVKNSNLYISYSNGEIHDYTAFGERVYGIPNMNTFGYVVMYDEKVIRSYSEYVVYETSHITGETVSKLSDFRNPVNLVDSCGNNILGSFDVTANTHAHPYADTVLDLLYHVGDVDNLSDVVDEKYWGNILTDIVFYYEDNTGKETSGRYSAIGSDNLTAINQAALDWMNRANPEYIYYEPTDNLKCDITYYNGAILEKVNGEFRLFGDNECLHGVKYVDTYVLVKTPIEYFVSKNQSYNIYYYKMVSEELTADYAGTDVNLPKTKFEVVINTDLPVGNITFSKRNSFTYSPIFRTENNIGSSSKSSVKSDIFIDRPIIKPTEKHLMLLDVHSLESMSNYGNGLMNIISNN